MGPNRDAAAAAHVVASQPPAVCPMVEYINGRLTRQQVFHTYVYAPVNGRIPLPTAAGLAIERDEAKYERREEVGGEQ